MRWFLNLSTRTKLFLSFGLMIIFLAVVIVTAYVGIITIQKSQGKLYQEDFANVADFWNLRANINGMRASQLMMMSVTKRSDQEVWHQDIKERNKRFDDVMSMLVERARNDHNFLSRLETLRTSINAYRQTQDAKLIPSLYKGKFEEAKILVFGILLEDWEKVRSIANELGDEVKDKAKAAVMQSTQNAKESIRIFMILGATAFFLALATAFFLSRIIANLLIQMSGVAERVAIGDLTVNVPSDNRADEVGTLAQTFRKMVENLREVNREIREGVNVLASSANEIQASTTQIVAGATETATAVNETTTTVAEFKQILQVSSQKAKYVSESAQNAALVSQTGGKAVEETIGKMNGIQKQMESIAESIVRLSKQSRAIGEIIATVNDIAEQSNILAVNASIEAAKAGEQGKGFAVVAQEIKSLAEQSKQATAQVRTILSDVQKATSAAVMATDQGSRAVEAGVKQSTQAGESIHILAESIAEAARAAMEIAASSQQQLVGTDQIALAMENIKQATGENVAGARQTETAAQNLHELGLKLKQLVEQYKV